MSTESISAQKGKEGFVGKEGSVLCPTQEEGQAALGELARVEHPVSCTLKLDSPHPGQNNREIVHAAENARLDHA
jgi:hypothetical protein